MEGSTEEEEQERKERELMLAGAFKKLDIKTKAYDDAIEELQATKEDFHSSEKNIASIDLELEEAQLRLQELGEKKDNAISHRAEVEQKMIVEEQVVEELRIERDNLQQDIDEMTRQNYRPPSDVAFHFVDRSIAPDSSAQELHTKGADDQELSTIGSPPEKIADSSNNGSGVEDNSDEDDVSGTDRLDNFDLYNAFLHRGVNDEGNNATSGPGLLGLATDSNGDTIPEVLNDLRLAMLDKFPDLTEENLLNDGFLTPTYLYKATAFFNKKVKDERLSIKDGFPKFYAEQRGKSGFRALSKETTHDGKCVLFHLFLYGTMQALRDHAVLLDYMIKHHNNFAKPFQTAQSVTWSDYFRDHGEEAQGQAGNS